MRIPGITIKGLMVAVAISAVDSFILVEQLFYGALLLTIVLNVGLILILRRERTKRRFWLGFEVVGLVLLGIYVGLLCCHVMTVRMWPWTLSGFILDRLPPAALDTVLPWRNRLLEEHLGEPEVRRMIWGTIRYESTIGLPLVLVAAIGGWIWKMIGARPVTGSNP